MLVVSTIATIACAFSVVEAMPRPKVPVITLEGQNSGPEVRRLMDAMLGRMFMPGMFGMLPPIVMPYGRHPLPSPLVYPLTNQYPSPEYSVSPMSGVVEPPRSHMFHSAPIPDAWSVSDRGFKSRYRPRGEKSGETRSNTPEQRLSPPSINHKTTPSPTAMSKKRPSSKFLKKLKRRYNNKKSFYQRIKAKHSTSSSINFKTRVPYQLFNRFPFGLLPGFYGNAQYRPQARGTSDTTTYETTTTTATTPTELPTTQPHPPANPAELRADVLSQLPYQPDIVFGTRDISLNAAQNAGPTYTV